MSTSEKNRARAWHGLVLLFLLTDAVAGQPASSSASAGATTSTTASAPLDRSGRSRVGEASYYGRQFAGKEMANGQTMKPDGNGAASKTLPLGTEARVTNLETGKSQVVVIKDRGPYVGDRIVDVTPKTAEKLDMKHEGVAPVRVTPLKLPKPADSAPQQGGPSVR